MRSVLFFHHQWNQIISAFNLDQQNLKLRGRPSSAPTLTCRELHAVIPCKRWRNLLKGIPSKFVPLNSCPGRQVPKAEILSSNIFSNCVCFLNCNKILSTYILQTRWEEVYFFFFYKKNIIFYKGSGHQITVASTLSRS